MKNRNHESTILKRYRDRFVEVIWIRAGDLCQHPHNYKTHGQEHALIVQESLGEFGIIKPLLAYRSERMGNKLTLLDGHGRLKVDPNEEWPVWVLDIDDDEADSLLLVIDTVGKLADEIPEQAAYLAAKADIASPALLAYVQDYAEALQKGAGIQATGWMTIKIKVPSDLKQLWAMHLVVHDGNEVAAFENLLAQADPIAYLDVLDEREQKAVTEAKRVYLRQQNQLTHAMSEDDHAEETETG